MAHEPTMTWGEFKRQVEAAGVTDECRISYIDWDGMGGDVATVEFAKRWWGATPNPKIFCVQ